MSVYDINKNIVFNKTFTSDSIIRGTTYNFSDMNMTDESEIATLSSEHIENSQKTIKLTANTANTTYTVTFDGVNIKTNGQAINFWIYMSRKDKGVTGGFGQYSTFTSFSIKLNGSGTTYNYVKDSAVNNSMIIAGMNCYHWCVADTPSTITSITITIKSIKGGGSIYLDSVEVGRRMSIPHFVFNFDSSGANFYDVGYPLFKKYGFPATFDYWGATTDGGNSGTWTDAEDAKKHFEMMQNGFDYGVYSKWVNTAQAESAEYDNEEHYSLWQEQAKLMFDSNNSLGIFYPSTVHSTGHKSGEVYARAMAEKDFMIVRADYAYMNGTNCANREFMTGIDSNSYKEVVPFYCTNCWEATDDLVIATKKVIDKVITEKQNVMWMSHTIQPQGYDHANDTLNIGYNAMEEILKYLKTKSDAGLIQVDSTASFMQSVYPDVYNNWKTKKDLLTN